MIVLCPHCQNPVDAKALFCRGCGSDLSEDWTQELDPELVPMDEDSYAELLAEEGLGSDPEDGQSYSNSALWKPILGISLGIALVLIPLLYLALSGG